MGIGTLMIYGGITGIGLSSMMILVCLWRFPKQRKKLLQKLREEE